MHARLIGQILEVIPSRLGTRDRVAWDDGHESTFRPAAGSARTARPRTDRPA